MNLANLLYPECAIRPERFATKLDAVSCANKTARINSGVIFGILMVAVLLYIMMGNNITPGLLMFMAGALVVCMGLVVLAGVSAASTWTINDIKISHLVNSGMTRTAAEDIVVRENMQQEQLDISKRSADAQQQSANALMLNTGLNFANSFNRSN